MVRHSTGGSGGAVKPLRYPVLDSLRGIAALAVVFHHIPTVAGISAAGFDLHFGRMVDLFFILSGFVIAASYGAKLSAGFPFSRFIWLRWGRVWPLHAAMIAVFALSMLVLGVLRPELRTHGLLAGRNDPADLPIAFLLLQGVVPSLGPIWNHPSWSVSVEMLLYLLAAAGWRIAGERVWLAWLALAVAVLTFTTSDGDFFGLTSNIGRGIAGFGLGLALHRAWERSTPPAIPVAAATALELAAFVAVGAVLWGSGSLLAFDLAATALVALGVLQRGLVSRLLCAAPFQWLGTMSYALYIVHVFVIGRVFDLLAVLQPRLGLMIADTVIGGQDALVGPGWQADAMKLLIMALCLIVAVPFAKLIEQPARAWSRRMAGQPMPKPAN
ncbi:acyltransferase family protein [Novosphingobium jiangmenense]|uniref:Acyltransferase n=1 Tax=Novosphingobium jiangmenense TaxID=2791981 RepID=A0ABS0HLS7_9SPHN|nr:acyltransferase [Novosphingobium jiangmenense]